MDPSPPLHASTSRHPRSLLVFRRALQPTEPPGQGPSFLSDGRGWVSGPPSFRLWDRLCVFSGRTWGTVLHSTAGHCSPLAPGSRPFPDKGQGWRWPGSALARCRELLPQPAGWAGGPGGRGPSLLQGVCGRCPVGLEEPGASGAAIGCVAPAVPLYPVPDSVSPAQLEKDGTLSKPAGKVVGLFQTI